MHMHQHKRGIALVRQCPYPALRRQFHVIRNTNPTLASNDELFPSDIRFAWFEGLMMKCEMSLLLSLSLLLGVNATL